MRPHDTYTPTSRWSIASLAATGFPLLEAVVVIHVFRTLHERHATRARVTTVGKDCTDRLAHPDPLPRTWHVLNGGILEPRARVPHHDVSRRKDHGLANGTKWTVRSREVEFGKRASGTRFCVHAEHRNFMRAFHEFHRCTPARIHFDRVRQAVSGHEIDAVASDQIQIFHQPPRQA